MKWILIFLCPFFLISIAYGVELEFFVSLDNPYGYTKDTPGGGAMDEVVKELARRVGQKFNVSYVPWARAQYIAKSQNNVGIFPIGRDPEREPFYTWIVEIFGEPYVFMTMKKSKVDISTIEAIKKLNVGALTGSLAEILMLKHGIKTYTSVTRDEQNVRMLKSGRIDAWIAPLSFKDTFKDVGLGGDELRVGATLTNLHFYVAGSKNLDKATVTKWRRAFKSMKRDGTYKAILKKYKLDEVSK